MLWKYVFNGSLKSYGHTQEAAKAARGSGYEFMAWNGRIYFLGDENIFETMLTVDIIEGKEK